MRATLLGSCLWGIVALTAGGCSSGGGGGGGGVGAGGGGGGQAELVSLSFGNLVDVFGLRVTPQGSTIELYRRDVVIGGNIQDQRPSNSTLTDNEILYDFIASDPDTLQPRLFIPRDLNSQAFRDAFEALDNELREVTPMRAGPPIPGQPFSVVPRNAALQLTFSGPLGIDDEFFVERNAQGQVIGLRNTEAVQLLRIEGDPNQPNGFVPLPVRVVVGERTIVLDPVLLGSEGLQYQTVNNASGMPASPDQIGANLRVAVALEGPLAIPGLRESTSTGLTGANNSGRNSIIRDFRSGNRNDTSASLVNGFLRDPLPLRLIGEIPMYLEAVDEVNAFTQEVTVFKNGISHEIDRGDVFRFVNDSSGIPFGVAEVVVDPDDDRDQPNVQHVRVRIRRVENLESIDPSNLPGYPADQSVRGPWLVQNAPRAVCAAEFTAGGEAGRDDPRNFLSFSPQPVAVDGTQPAPNQFVSPFASAIVRFNKPVDLSSVKWADTFFFAMRDLTTQASIDDFIQNRPNGTGTPGMLLETFEVAKYRTPYLITSRVIDENGSQTSLRLQPTSGFYLDQRMRTGTPGVDYSYYLHLISDSLQDGGISDLAGNRLDLQGTTAGRSSAVVMPFTVDTRLSGGQPVAPDNIAISIVRRFASQDEDARPSYFLPEEVQPESVGTRAKAFPLQDVFGGFVYVDGRLQARPAARVRVVVDNRNQVPAVQQPRSTEGPPNPLGYCPQSVSGEDQNATNTAGVPFGQGIQNPLNPYGCRLQTVWREVDLSLSRTDPFDFNLDIEQMYWAPFQAGQLNFDEFDRVSLFLGTSEFRPAPCVGAFSATISTPDSGLRTDFERNYAWNPAPTGSGNTIESQAPRADAYVNVPMTIDPSQVVLEPTQLNRYLPLPDFRKPYFVFRDETVVEQGGNIGLGSDLSGGTYTPYIVSPFNMGLGSRWVDTNGQPGDVRFVNGFWLDGRNQNLTSGTDNFTGGLIGNIALPLLADFWTFCDSSELPAGAGYIASGFNGWQTSVTVGSGPTPNFRVLTAGRAGANPQCRQPASSSTALGGLFDGGSTLPGDNTLYWVMLDVLKRQTVITNGFIDIYNPHRVPQNFDDARLGPFFLVNGTPTLPPQVLPRFDFEFDPPLSQLPAGTSFVPQFRAASAVDPTPWYWNAWANNGSTLYPTNLWDANIRQQQLRPNADNFPLDPFKAGDAHMRKWDTRAIPGTAQARNFWAYLYNRTITRYVEDPNELMNLAYTSQFAGPNEPFTPNDVRYVNWRFIVSSNAESDPPVSPAIETFALSYRFQTPQ